MHRSTSLARTRRFGSTVIRRSVLRRLRHLPPPPAFAAVIALSLHAAVDDEVDAHTKRPNIVVILADDLGYGDVSCYGNPGYETPHIDRLAKQGMRFTDFHSSGPVCSPTRAGLLTGRYQQRAGIPAVINADPHENRHHGLQPNEVTFAELLSDAGYATAVFGKWHLGYHGRFNPIHQGFEVFRGYVSGNIDYISHVDRMGYADWWQGDRLAAERGYVTHLITKHALRFIEGNRERPFCLYLAHEAVHAPYQGPGDAAVRHVGRPGGKRTSAESIRSAYREMALAMDESVGEVIAMLRRLDLAESTFVFFFSDNGANQHGSNGRFRGGKGSLWEGGHRVPAIACWPGKIPAGSVTGQTTISIDLMPTWLELARAKVPQGHKLDGTSLAPLLLNNETLPQRTLYWEYRGRAAARRGPWKLVVGQSGLKQDPGLFNLAVNPREQNNLADAQPQRVASMLADLQRWKSEVREGATAQPRQPSEPVPR